MRALADTHVLLRWFLDEGRLTKAQRRALARSSAQNPLLVAEISLLEIALLFERGRIRLPLPLRDWLEQATAPPLVELVGISPAIAAAVASLPSTFNRDPADRVIVATALTLGATLLTSDEAIVGARIVTTVD